MVENSSTLVAEGAPASVAESATPKKPKRGRRPKKVVENGVEAVVDTAGQTPDKVADAESTDKADKPRKPRRPRKPKKVEKGEEEVISA